MNETNISNSMENYLEKNTRYTYKHFRKSEKEQDVDLNKEDGRHESDNMLKLVPKRK